MNLVRFGVHGCHLEPILYTYRPTKFLEFQQNWLYIFLNNNNNNNHNNELKAHFCIEGCHRGPGEKSR